MENSPLEIKRLQGCINNLISVLAFPALWTGREPSQIVRTLLDGLVGMMRLDFAYAQTSSFVEGSPIEMLRLAQRQTPMIQPQEVGHALNRWLADELPTSPLAVPNPLGEGEVTIAVLRLGLQNEMGVLVAASQRADFPTTIEMLLLRVAVNQAAIGLQEARLLSERKRAAEELEQKVAERTKELSEAIEELGDQITRRERLEEEQRKLAALVEHSTDFIGIALPEGPVLFLNPAGQEMVGLAGDEQVRTTTMIDYIAEQEKERFRDDVLPAVLRDGHWEGEIRIRHFETGEAIPMLHNVFSINESGNGRRVAFATIGRDITERKRAETKLREADARVEMVLDSITDKFFALDDQWRYTYFNRQAKEQIKFLGKDPANMVGKVLWGEFPAPTSEAQLRRAMSERVIVNHEFYYPPLGEWLENRIFPSPDGGLAIFQSDVSERKQAEEELRQSEERFRLMVENVKGYAIFMLDPEGLVVTWNAGAEQIKGYRAEEVMGKHFSVFYSEEAIDRGLPESQLKLAANEGRFEEEGWRVRKDGTQFWAHVVLTAIRDPKGGLVGFSKVTRDLTERKRAEEKLRRSEAYLAEGQRLSHTGSWSWNVSTGELFWSVEHFRICGLDPEQVKPVYPTMEWVHAEDRAYVQEVFEKAIRERTDFALDCRVVRPDGEIRHVHSFSRPVFDDAGNLTEHVGTIMDITERTHVEEALREAHAELAHATRLTTVGEMTASIAHEVNQPLAAIVTNGQACLRLLSGGTPDLEGAREAVESMVSDGMLASEVIKRIRKLLKKDALEKSHLDVNVPIQDVLALAAAELAKNRVSLRTELESSLPPVLADRVQLQQVVLNLILNGKESMSVADWRPRELLVSSRKSKPNHVLVAVRDSGVGLDPTRSDHIFDAFYTTKSGGMGLGLSISRTIIEEHGGRLWATPNEDQGTTFWFSLPTGV